jgi:transposase
VLAAFARLAGYWRVGPTAPHLTGSIARRQQVGFVSRRCRQFIRACGFWGAKTGDNPTDRRKQGSKHHILTEAQGIPIVVRLTGANQHDVTQLIALVNGIPAIGGKPGRPLRRPECLYADRAYHSELHSILLRHKGIEPRIAQRGQPHGSGLGKVRWVVERTLSWLHQYRRLRVRYERRADIHEAFLILGCALICRKTLHPGF